jgi:hypothetical protein
MDRILLVRHRSLPGFVIPPKVLGGSPLSVELPVGHYFSELPKLALAHMSARPLDPARNVIADAVSSRRLGFVILKGESVSLSVQNTVRQQKQYGSAESRPPVGFSPV